MSLRLSRDAEGLDVLDTRAEREARARAEEARARAAAERRIAELEEELARRKG